MLLDIELRFTERMELVYPAESGIARRVRMLQSRKLVSRGGAHIPEWTEWADVPLAPQAGAAKGGDL